MPPKAPITCNWVRSNVTNETLADFVKSGYLPRKEVMSYRAPDPSEERPQPRDGEVVIFADHMSRGFAPPGSKFFRDVLNFFDLRPQDIGPNLPCPQPIRGETTTKGRGGGHFCGSHEPGLRTARLKVL